ncbi:alpha/beta hydrolase [Phenylobacterium sp.]|uniref:alpha/beta fold hydrolase n=1 Tax=Phenylobacterium sp. TaxID=1871053 RepID=UPI0025E00C2E|nr:alpha/beta hydrolase [Phenylobacterium sp.]MCA6289506.1 alpha/beta hydrolase [Phenylobacterium sp.]MCA6311095.1 alpha/beta hydrolase [Phenylobacterium sp.]MCA6323990.1 alpha/beta hydrolase [Phenylobacterium sp.]MCA6336446.1 alpha/beta hydrolase [Phenylobacterium sp.]MCA6339508.1 alpha/beta hydrolase [Phenylobacterium sp.]
MPFATNGDVRLCWESFGDPGAPAILLVNGLGSQMTRWPEGFCALLVARGYRAIRFDNRDAGLSTGFGEGEAYTLEDMAADAMAVLDAAGVEAAHVTGVSMGGMISQVIAADHAHRTLSLTSIMSTSSASGLPQATPRAMAVLTQPTPDFRTDPEAHIAAAVENARVIGSPSYPWPDGALAERARAEASRAWNPTGSGRQMRAVGATGDRSARLARITVPTVVLHGADDPLLPAEGGRDTAAKIPGAELRIIEGMGHDLPPALFGLVADAILAAAARAG